MRAAIGRPFFLTATETVGTPDQRHIDVSLWFALDSSRDQAFTPDLGEFRGIRWWTAEEVRDADPNALTPPGPHDRQARYPMIQAHRRQNLSWPAGSETSLAAAIAIRCGSRFRFRPPAPDRSQGPHMKPPAEYATQPHTAVTAIGGLLPTTFHVASLPAPARSDRSAQSGCFPTAAL